MPENLNNLLQQQLRDVHLPEHVSWWPLAVGWWLVIALVILGTIVGLVYLARKRQRNHYRKAALTELQACFTTWLEDQNIGAYLQTANAILKRCVLQFDNHSSAAAQSGLQWLDTLSQFVRQPLPEDLRSALSSQCYQPNPQVDVELIHPQIVDWVKTHQAVKTQAINTKLDQQNKQNKEAHYA